MSEVIEVTDRFRLVNFGPNTGPVGWRSQDVVTAEAVPDLRSIQTTPGLRRPPLRRQRACLENPYDCDEDLMDGEDGEIKRDRRKR